MDVMLEHVEQLRLGAQRGEMEAVERALDAGTVDVDRAGDVGRTALHLAAASGKVPIVERLLAVRIAAGQNPARHVHAI
jgi:ankyrin repeat protein